MAAGQQQEVEPIEAQPRDGEQSLPLSYAQQRLWLIHQLEPDNAAYNIPRVVRIEGEINLAALQESLDQIVNRHEVFVQGSTSDKACLRKLIEQSPTYQLQLTDMSLLAEPHRSQQAEQIQRLEVGRGFDLARGPVLRVRLEAAEDNICSWYASIT